VVKGGSNGHDIAVDWWSVGVLTYELLTGASPFTVEGEQNAQKDISKRILHISPPIPDKLGVDVRDFILKLLVRDPRQRLGGNNADAVDIKSHPFFKNINWDLLAKKQIPAPFKPQIEHELDTSNFSDEFTRLPVSDSPCTVPPNPDRLFRGKGELHSIIIGLSEVLIIFIFNQQVILLSRQAYC
jgi:ribosomal protein S6 kinase alpha-5